MYTKKWTAGTPPAFVPEDMESVAMEAMQLIDSQFVFDADGEQLFNDLNTLTDFKAIALEQVSEAPVDYAGSIRAVNDIKSRWFLPQSVGLESEVNPREFLIKEIDVAVEGLLSTIGDWISAKFNTMWSSFKNLFNVSEQVRTWLDKNEDAYLEFAAGQQFKLKWKNYHSNLFINGRPDIPRHLTVGEQDRELARMSENFYAVIDPNAGYSLDAFSWSEAEQSLNRIGISCKADTAIQRAMPMIIKKDSRVTISALPGNVFIATAITPTGTRKTGWSTIPLENKTDLSLSPADTTAMIPALKRIVELASVISHKYNVEHPDVKKMEQTLADFESNGGKGDVKQLKQNIKNAIAFESAISASITRTLIGLHSVAKQSLNQVN